MRHLAASIIALLAVARVSAAQVEPPTVRSIQVGRDTIRFFARGEEYGGAENPVFGFVRATRQWVRIGGRERTTPRHLPWELRDAIRVAPGFRLVGSPKPGPKTRGFSSYALSGDDGRRYPVDADASPSAKWAVASHEGSAMYDFSVRQPRVSVNLTRWARSSDALWFSSYGGADELGALFRFDLASRRFDVVADTLLDKLNARTMAATSGAVWLAGTRYESMEWERGLYCYDAVRHITTRLTTATAPLPGDTVLALAAAGDTLWVATTQGLALLDAGTGRWDVRWFRATATIDTIAVSGMGYTNEEGNREFSEDMVGVVGVSFALSAEPPRGEAGRRLAYAVDDALGARSDRTFTPDSFFALLTRIPAAHFDSAAAGRHRLAHALARPEIVRRIAARDSANDDAFGLSLDDIEAIGLLGDRAYLPTLQALPDDGYDEDYLAQIALARVRLGDTSRVPALRERVGRGSLGFNDLRYAEVLHETGDTAVLPALVAFADSTRYNSAYAAVQLFASRAEWRALVAHFVDNPNTRDDFLEWTVLSDRVDTLTDPAIRAALARGARLTLATPTPQDTSGRVDHITHYRAAAVAVALRDPALEPALFPLLASDGTDWEIAMRALIELTGVDTVPVPPRPSAAERQAARAFWEKWWNATGGRGKVVGPAEGEEALRRWRLRWELGEAAR